MLQIQISKKKKKKWHGLRLKRKLHQLWRIAMWLSHNCSKSNECLTAACCESLYWSENFWISLTVWRLHMCKQSVRHVSTTKYLWAIVSIGRQRLVKSCFFFCFLFFCFFVFLFFFNSHYLEKGFHVPGAKPFYKIKKSVHGPGPKRGSTNPQSMFCPHPL